MNTPITSRALLVVASGMLFIGTAAAQSNPSTRAQGSANAQGEASVDRSGARASGSAESSSVAKAGNNNAKLASGSSMNAELTRSIDSNNSKPGDPVLARSTQSARTEDGVTIPKGSMLKGHVSEVHARGKGESSSSMGIVFDKVVTKDGHEMALSNLTIQALAAAESSASAGGSGAEMMALGSASGTARTGGGLLGGATGAVGGAVGAGVGTVAGGSAALASRASGTLRAAPGAIGGLDTSGMLTAKSAGVFGLQGTSLASAAAGSANGTVIQSASRSVHLDQGTRMLLGAQSEAGNLSGAGQLSNDASVTGKAK